MKIAITTAGNDLSADVDTRFGRAPQFLIFNTETSDYSIKENIQNLHAAQGAGIQSATNVANEKVHAVISGNCGPKAFSVLNAAGIKVYTCSGITVEEALAKLNNNELEAAEEANVEGHWM